MVPRSTWGRLTALVHETGCLYEEGITWTVVALASCPSYALVVVVSMLVCGTGLAMSAVCNQLQACNPASWGPALVPRELCWNSRA